MRTSCTVLMLSTFATHGVPAQADPATLQVLGAQGQVARLLAIGMAPPPAAAGTAERQALALLQCLHRGDIDAARARLVADPPADDPDAVSWACIGHLWYLRASGDRDSVRTDLPGLRRAGATAESSPPAPTFTDHALRVHARFCLGALLEACGDERAAEQETRSAAASWLDLERQCWQPGRGHFRSRPTAGSILVPEPVQASVLAPAAAGMLIASGDRMLRHLRTSVDALLAEATAGPREAAWILGGAAQLGDHRSMDRAWQLLLTTAGGATAPTATDAAWTLDAMLFAITGLRTATGAGVDVDLVRLRPHLPPDHRQLAVRHLLARGAWLSLDLELRSGPAQDDERDGDADVPAGPRLFTRIRLERAVDPLPRTVLLQGTDAQHLSRLQVGGCFVRSLPIGPP